MLGPHLRKNARSALPALQWLIEEAKAAGKMAASDVAIATCAASSAEKPVPTSP
jgi:hypothetical protein